MQIRICPICKGRGEVEAGITYGRNYGWIDDNGVSEREAVKVEINPYAYDKRNKTIWFLTSNSMHPLWTLAICMVCEGSGMVKG